MPDEIENLLQQFRPAGPPASLREKMLAVSSTFTQSGEPATPATSSAPRWPVFLFRTAIAATLLLSLSLIHAAGTLNQSSAAQVGIRAPRWTPEAQQAADLVDPDGPAGRRYIALCLLADHAHPSQGDFR